MKNISKVLSIILLLTFSVVINQCASNQKTDIKPVSFIEKVPETIKKIYFKDGKVIQCDIVWEGRESDILCDKSDDILAYSADEVDLVKTFGETHGKEISKRYEERVKHRELMSSSKIVTPEQERNMRRAEGEQLEREKEYNKLIAPVTSSVIESKVDGEFEGWDGDTVVKLINGQIWHQTGYHYHYHYAYMPDVLIYRSGGQWKMKVEGTRKAVAVERLR